MIKQLGSILLLCTLLLSINSYVFAGEYETCITDVKQQAKNVCESFENQLLDECNKTKKFEGTEYSTVLECQKALQTKIDTCITNLETQNKTTCDIFHGATIEMNKCINDKIKTSEQTSTLAKLKAAGTNCQQIAVAEHQAHYDQCESIAKANCGIEAITDTTCLDTIFNSCRAQADGEREIKATKCLENYNNLFTQLSQTAKITCEDELKAAQDKADANTKADSKTQNCGNGTIDGTGENKEECDDGNKDIGDGCDTECKIEYVVPPNIPIISTLVRPGTEKVSNVSPYLSSTFLPRVAKTIVSFGIGAAVIGLILGSIGMLTAYGNDEKYGNAKKGIYFSVIGLIICLLAFAIVQLIFYTGFQAGQIK